MHSSASFTLAVYVGKRSEGVNNMLSHHHHNNKNDVILIILLLSLLLSNEQRYLSAKKEILGLDISKLKQS